MRSMHFAPPVVKILCSAKLVRFQVVKLITMGRDDDPNYHCVLLFLDREISLLFIKARNK